MALRRSLDHGFGTHPRPLAFLVRGRFGAILFASLTLLGTLLIAMGASAQGNSEAAHSRSDDRPGTQLTLRR